MKRSSVFLMALTWASQMLAQQTFEKIYLGGSSKVMIQLSSQNVFTNLARSSTVNTAGTAIINSEGTILHTNCYAIDTFLVLQSVMKYAENEFYFVGGYYKDTCTVDVSGKNTYPVIGKMDSLGNMAYLWHYNLNWPDCSKLAGDLEIGNDRSVITWGRDARFFVLKVDSSLAPAWSAYFTNHGGFQFIKELPGGDLLAGINMDTAGAVVARLDAGGNFLWCKSYIRPKGMVHDCLIGADTSFIIIGTTDSLASTNVFDPLPPNYQPKLFMMKLNGSGDVMWCKGYDSEPHPWYVRRTSRIVRAQDGNYVILANLGKQNSNSEYRLYLLKTDQNGDTLWTRSAGENGYTYATSDLLEYSDGGFMISGTVYGNLPEMWTGAPFIFKTDSVGHLPCSEQWHPVQVLDLFPTDSSFMLTSVDGATVHPAFVSDTVFDPISVYDACSLSTSLPPSYAHRRPIALRPNPTTGRVTVEFDDPLEVDSFYSVYDATGRLLYQRPLPAGKHEAEIDLSRFGRGTYVLKFTGPEGVRHERVVLE